MPEETDYEFHDAPDESASEGVPESAPESAYDGDFDRHPDSGAGGDFLSSLSDGHRALAAGYGWQDAQGVFDGYKAMEDRLSNAVPLPEKGASAEEQAEFYSEISKTWTPKDGYRFRMPEALPENFPYDEAFAKEAEGWFQEAGLHPEAAQKLHDRWVGKMAEHFSDQEQTGLAAAREEAKRSEAAHRELVRDYGVPESDGYQNVVAKADRALSGLRAQGIDLTDWFADKGALSRADGNGLQQVADPTAVKLLAFIHDSAFSEDGLAGLIGGSEAGNPFDRDQPDLRQQSDLLDRNPARARQLILSAGRDPGLFGV